MHGKRVRDRTEVYLSDRFLRGNCPLDSLLYRVKNHFLHSYDSTNIAEYLANMTSNKSLMRCICPLNSILCRVDKHFLHSYYPCDSITITRGPLANITSNNYIFPLVSYRQYWTTSPPPPCTGRNSNAKGSFCSSKSFYLKQK